MFLFLFMLFCATHFFFLSNNIIIGTVYFFILISFFKTACVRLFDMFDGGWCFGFMFFFHRYYSANGKMENCTFFLSFLDFFFLARDCICCCCCLVVVPLRPCLFIVE